MLSPQEIWISETICRNVKVSNWFINARVRLWKPMVEEMYQQEAKEEGSDHNEGSQSTQKDDVPVAGNNQTVSQSSSYHHSNQHQQQQRHNPQGRQRSVSEIDATERFSSVDNNNKTQQQLQQAHGGGGDGPASSSNPINLPPIIDTPDLCGAHADLYSEYGAAGLGPATRMRLGTSGDVSLTLGLRHAGNTPEKNRPFSIRDFGGC